MPATMDPVLDPARFVRLGQPTLSGGGVTLHPMGPRHAGLLLDGYADPAVQHWHGRTLTADEAGELAGANAAQWAAGTRANWAVYDGGEPAGRLGLNEIQLFSGEAEIAYWVLPAARGRSVMPRALALLVPWAFDELGLMRLKLVHSVRNEASCRVAMKAGFALEGTMRGQLRHVDGWHDAHLHARIASDPR